MPRLSACRVPALVLALAVGACPLAAAEGQRPTSFQRAALQGLKPTRAAQAETELLQLRPSLGLDARTGFRARHTSVSPEGRTVVRLQQTFEGRRVWGGEAIAHVEPEGSLRALTQGVKPQVVVPAGAPAISADKARDIALQSLAPKGPLGAAPKVEEVVFPTRFTGGLATRFDAARGGAVVDRDLSVWAKAPTEAYVRAYEVRTLITNPKDGHKEITFIVDANTGSILRKWNALQGDTPAQGTGTSYYRGAVPLSTTQSTAGTFSLQAQDRGSLPQPYVAEQGGTQIGLTTYYSYADMDPASPWYGMLGFTPYEGHASNTWGNGALIPPAWDFNFGGVLWDFSGDGLRAWMQGAVSPAGETTAVDAHYGLSASWDFYKNVFGRDGIDDLGTSTFAVVHSLDYGMWGATPLFDNAYWSPWYFGMVFGDGTASVRQDPWSMDAMTELDITGHELTHGVTRAEANLIYEGQSGGLNEATSDMLGKMVQAYTDGGATGAVVPNFVQGDLTRWEIGHASRAQGGLRYMYKPSLDHYSADGWYDGIEMLDVHFSSGPPNRFFYFLCEGSSPNASLPTHSPYLPGGMTGIGNHKATRIWYKALTEYLTEDSDFDAARAATLAAAQDLFGATSAEATAVLNAWAAVNVGSAPGQPARVRVSFPVVHPEGSFLDAHVVPSGLFRKVQLFPTKARVSVRCQVENTSNTKVTFSAPVWSANGVSDAGIINADGTWTTPSFNFYYDLLEITATSQADPTQFAKSRVLLIPADADTDNETDALDMGEAAMSWGLPQTPHPAAWVAGSGNDWDIVFLAESLANAFPIP